MAENTEQTGRRLPAEAGLVFVYGTLMRDEYNHHFLRAQRFLGPHLTEASFRLLNTGPYPAALADGGTALRGEVYQVNTDCMALLDRLEDYPDMYTRRRIPTPFGPAWIYLWVAAVDRDWPELDGDWRGRHS